MSDTKARPHEVAAYVATMARELKAMAAPHGLTALVYLLELVRLEAESRAADDPNRFATYDARRN